MIAPHEIEFLARSLELDTRLARDLYSSRKRKFEEFSTRLERYAAQAPEFTEAEKPSLWAFVRKTDGELHDLEAVLVSYEQILEKLRGGLRNVA